MAAAAMNAATGEIARGTGDYGERLCPFTGWAVRRRCRAMIVGGSLKQTALRSGLEGVKAAAAASDIHALNGHLELEYSLSGDGIDEYSASHRPAALGQRRFAS
jgi:hypothetical protein